jgi:endonuclease/exonuclease/phosphatase family metal-dependent hydrolase
MLQIDHVLVSSGVTVTGAHAPNDALSRRASDHLPLVVDFTIDVAPAFVSMAS